MTRWSNYLKQAVDMHGSVANPLQYSGVESSFDKRYRMALNVAIWLNVLYEGCPQLSMVRIRVSPVAEKWGDHEVVLDFNPGGELVFELGGQSHSVEIDSEFVGEVEELYASHGLEMSPQFKAHLEKFVDDMNMNDSVFNWKDVNEELFGGAVNLEVQRVDYESCLIDGVPDDGLMVDNLFEGGMVLLDGYESSSSVSIEDHSLDFSVARPVWDYSSLSFIARHLAAGMHPDELDLRGISPLMAAVASGNMAAFDALVAAGADCSCKTMSGLDLLGCAILFSNLPALRSVVDRVGLQEGCAQLPNVLLAAYVAEHHVHRGMEVFRFLLESGMSVSTPLPNGRDLVSSWDDFGLGDGLAKAFFYSFLSRADLMDAMESRASGAGGVFVEKKSVSMSL